MRATVRLFAILRERVGADSIDIELPEPATVADALEVLSRRDELADVLDPGSVVMAVNLEYSSPGREIDPGDELALIPPVSGGCGDVHARVGDKPLSLQHVSDLVARPAAGAIVTFQGTTREVQRLDYEAYAEMAERRIGQILSECLERHELQAIAAEHRVGTVPLGQTSVIVAASAAHRDAAFAGAREAIDRIKREAPIWKREPRDGDARWVEGVLP
ncbi:MAG TPA: molybdenum cofactor biosynthesis protein MoaE [Solirubrobacteraceae bacterium]|nr:molybdenum cofactor biosynthesis protein MoaE [Solirubrobacteraceae bacterium]